MITKLVNFVFNYLPVLLIAVFLYFAMPSLQADIAPYLETIQGNLYTAFQVFLAFVLLLAIAFLAMVIYQIKSHVQENKANYSKSLNNAWLVVSNTVLFYMSDFLFNECNIHNNFLHSINENTETKLLVFYSNKRMQEMIEKANNKHSIFNDKRMDNAYAVLMQKRNEKLFS